MKNRIISVLLLTTILFSLSLPQVFANMIYAPDGRTADVPAYQVEAYKAVGWYDYPVTTIYAPDGRTAVISAYEVEAYKSVGWYHTVTLYAPDGRTINVAYPDVQTWVNVGWSTIPFPVNTNSNYYPETTVPTYTSITGVPLKHTKHIDDEIVYIYPLTKYGEYYEAIDYYGYFLRQNWIDLDTNNDDASVYSFALASPTFEETLQMMIFYDLNEVWVGVYKN